MSSLIAAVLLLIPLVGGLALRAWWQITRDLIVEDTDEDDADCGGTPRTTRRLENLFQRERHGGSSPHPMSK